MKKVALTVAILSLGLAACGDNNAENTAANETVVENSAETDVNAASNDAALSADAALNAADNAIENAGEAVENAGDAVANAADNAQ
jgi:predicted small secreted protein